MPLYTYECHDCQTKVEIFHGMMDTDTQTCATCQGNMGRVPEWGMLNLKGQGTYDKGKVLGK
jgi:putative FmdB family regulatory protein